MKFLLNKLEGANRLHRKASSSNKGAKACVWIFFGPIKPRPAMNGEKDSSFMRRVSEERSREHELEPLVVEHRNYKDR
jgi:hypothetical protein